MEKKKTKKKVSYWQSFKEYNAATTVHGSKYTTEPGSHQSERICWMVVMILALGLSVHLVSLIMINWIENPVLTSIDNTDYPASNIEFPAVTICPSYKALPSKIISEVCRLRLDEAKTNETADAFVSILQRIVSRVIDTVHLIGSTLGNNDVSNFDTFIKKKLNFTSAKTAEFIRKISPSCKDYILHCEWLGVFTDCSKLFQVHATDDGFCCTFNAVSSKERLTDVGTAESTEIDYGSKPDPDDAYNCLTNLDSLNDLEPDFSSTLCKVLRQDEEGLNVSSPGNVNNVSSTENSTKIFNVYGPGIKNGLRIVLDSLPCGLYPSTTFNGFKVLVHHPEDFPLIKNRGIAVQENSEAFITVRAYKIDTTESTRKYGSAKRGCNFPDEKQLRYFSTYRQSSCEIENFLQIVQQKCSCKPYYLPGNATMCIEKHFDCVNSVQRETFSNMDCLPGCQSTAYDISVTNGGFPMTNLNMSSTFPGFTEREDSQYSAINIFFDSSTIVKYKRDELYTVVSIISNIGGSLGLCMGFSLVSAIEFFYHFTLRHFLKKSGQRD